MLPASELSDMRDEQELALPDTCTIQVNTQTNTKGSVVESYANTYTGVACRIAPSSRQAAEYVLGLALAAISDHILTLAFDQVVQPGYRVIYNSVTYEVTGVANDLASWRTARRVGLKRIQ